MILFERCNGLHIPELFVHYCYSPLPLLGRSILYFLSSFSFITLDASVTDKENVVKRQVTGSHICTGGIKKEGVGSKARSNVSVAIK